MKLYYQNILFTFISETNFRSLHSKYSLEHIIEKSHTAALFILFCIFYSRDKIPHPFVGGIALLASERFFRTYCDYKKKDFFQINFDFNFIEVKRYFSMELFLNYRKGIF